jgi:cytochrome c
MNSFTPSSRLPLGLHAAAVVFGSWAVLGPGMPNAARDGLHAAESTDAAYDVARFEVTPLATGLVQPMELDVGPDGEIYLIELGGVLKLIDPATGDAREIGRLSVTTEQENGLIGLAIDPNFSENRWIYLQYSPPGFSGQHVSRFTLVDGQLDLASEKVLFTYEEQRRECCHHAGSLEFGPDGTLFIGTGDNTNPFDDSQGYAPIDQRAGREPWDAQRTSGNTKNYNGKILRIRPEADGTYSIPDGNLFPKDGSLGHPEIYVMGCRNPWRISVDQKTGDLYWGDVGPDAGGDGPRGPRGYDEINQAREAGNFGWPYFIGDNFAYPIIDFESGTVGLPLDPAAPENHSVNNTGSTTLPPARPAMVYYPGSPTEAFPAAGSGGRTACAGPVYHADDTADSPTRFPDAFDGALFAYDWSRNGFWTVHFDAEQRFDRMERFLPDRTFVRPIDMAFDHDGSLLLIEYGETWGVNPDARLVRIDYVRGNRTPLAAARAAGTVGREPLQVQLSAAASSDRDGDPLSYRWFAVGSGEAPSRQLLGETCDLAAEFDTPGVFTIELEVRDPHGATATTSLPVVVGNAEPQVRFLEPQDGDFFDPGSPLRYRLAVRDAEDGASDFDELEEAGDDSWQPIEATAASRLIVEAIPWHGNTSQADVHPGLQLIKQSDCLNCHAPQRRLIGPSFVEIATKYRDQPHQIEASVQRVLNGSTGVWGKVGMLPHKQHTPAEVHEMVSYVYSVTADSANPQYQGFTADVSCDADVPSLRLEATYTDLGRDAVPPASGQASVTLRSRTVEAEAADAYEGTQPLGSDRARGKVFMGAISHDGYLRFDRIDLSRVTAIAVQAASAGAGGTIEVRRASRDGDLLGSVRVDVNGDWEAFSEKRIPLADCDDRTDLYLVFVNPDNRGGLMNVDSISFQ